MESAVRTICEPIFDRPLKDISFGVVLLRLFEALRRRILRSELPPGARLREQDIADAHDVSRQRVREVLRERAVGAVRMPARPGRHPCVRKG